MKSVDLEKPFRLSRDFWAAYVLLGIPALWFAKPWSWALPVFSKIAGLVFLPFAAAIVCYCPFLVIAAITRGSSEERKIGMALVAALISAALFLTVVWFTYDLGSVPSRFGVAAVVIANLVFAFVRSRKPNQSSEPTSGIVTPRAEPRAAPIPPVAHL